MRFLAVVLQFVGGGKADSQLASERKLGRHNTGPLNNGLETAGSDPDGSWGRISPSRAAVRAANCFAVCGKVTLAEPWACNDSSTRGAFGIGGLFALAAIDNNKRERRDLDSINTLRGSSLFRGDVESRLVSVVLHHSSSPLADLSSACRLFGRNLNPCTGTGLARGCFFFFWLATWGSCQHRWLISKSAGCWRTV